MFLSSLRNLTKRARSASRPVRRQPRRTHLQCEEFEPRVLPLTTRDASKAPPRSSGLLSEVCPQWRTEMLFRARY